MKTRGFTLMEVLVVIAVLAVLVGIAVPRIKGFQEQANIQKARAGLKTLEMAIESYYRHHDSTYPPTIDTVSATYLKDDINPLIDSALYDPLAAPQTEYKYFNTGRYWAACSVGLDATIATSAPEANGSFTIGADDYCRTNGTISMSEGEPPVASYTLSFNANGGAGSMDALSIDEGDTVALTANSFTNDGFTFDGWATALEGEVVYADEADYTMGSSNVTLYAQWAVASYTVSFNANGGEGSMDALSIDEGDTVALTANSFTNDGFIFDGWATAPEGEVVYADEADYTMESSNVTLYAQWTPGVQTLYFKDWDDSDNAWDTLDNWWMDAGCTVPADALPADSDTVYIAGNLYSGPSVPVTLNHIHVGDTSTGGGPVVASFSGVTGDATFSNASILALEVIGNVVLNDTSAIQGGVVTGDVEFTGNDYSSESTGFNPQSGTVYGTVTFSGEAVTFTLRDEFWDVDSSGWAFSNGEQKWIFNSVVMVSGNTGYLNGDAEFNGIGAYNDVTGTIAGNGTFNDTSHNLGAIAGNGTFNEAAYNSGTVTGDAEFTGDDYVLNPVGIVDGTVTFSGSAVTFTLTGEEEVWIADSSGWIFSNGGQKWIFNCNEESASSNTAYVNGDAEFNGWSYNAGTIAGNGTFNGTSGNSDMVTGDAVFNNTSGNYGTVSGEAIFNGSSDEWADECSDSSFNHGTVGSATFNGLSCNGGVEDWGWGSEAIDGNVLGGAVFNDEATFQYGTIEGDAVFNDSSQNRSGDINGDVTFNGSTWNGGGISSATFNDDSGNSCGTVFGHATFNGNSNNSDCGMGGSVATATFNDTSSNGYYGTGTVTGNAEFNGSSINNGIVGGDAEFNGSSHTGSVEAFDYEIWESYTAYGTVSGNAIFNDTSYNDVGCTVTGNAAMNTTYVPANSGTISGTVTCPGVRTWNGSNCVPLP